MAGYATCIKFRSSHSRENGKGRSPQGLLVESARGSAGGESAGVGDVARCCPAVPVARVAPCSGPSREIWGWSDDKSGP